MTETHTTPAEACRTIAVEVRALSTTHTEAIDDAAKLIEAIGKTVGLGQGRELDSVAKTLREIAAYTAEGQDSIAAALDDLAADLDTPREQLITNLSAAVELLTPAEDARLRALATVQALHADGMISDTAAAALNLALETPDAAATEGTVLAHRLCHLFGVVAVFDPKISGYVVAITHDPAFKVGDVIPA